MDIEKCGLTDMGFSRKCQDGFNRLTKVQVNSKEVDLYNQIGL